MNKFITFLSVLMIGCGSSEVKTEETRTIDQELVSTYESPRMITGSRDAFTSHDLKDSDKEGYLGGSCKSDNSCNIELACGKDNKCWCDCSSGAPTYLDSPCSRMCMNTHCMILNQDGSTDNGRLSVKSVQGESFGFVWNCVPNSLNQRCSSNLGGCLNGLECDSEKCECDCSIGQFCHDSEFNLKGMNQPDVSHCMNVCKQRRCSLGSWDHTNTGTRECTRQDGLTWQYTCMPPIAR